MKIEEIYSMLESMENFLRGACFDVRIPQDTKSAMNQKAQEIAEFLQELEPYLGDEL